MRLKSGPALSASAAAEMAGERAALKRESMARKEEFLTFVKALLRDLREFDPAMHSRAKSIIQDCTEKKKRRVPGFDFEFTMRTRLRQLVGPSTWRRVERSVRTAHEQQQAERFAALQETRDHECHSAETSVAKQSETSSLASTSDAPEPERRSVLDVHSVNLSASDDGFEAELPIEERDKLEQLEAQAKVDAFVASLEKENGRTKEKRVGPRFIYI